MAVRVVTAPPPVRRSANPACTAHVAGKAVTFDHAFDSERLGSGEICTRDAAYALGEQRSCRQHLTVLVDETAGDWAGGLVPVQKLD